MRIAVLSASYAPEQTGTGPYSAELAESLALRGHEVRVVATFPYYPAWRADVPRGTLVWKRESDGPLRITRCRTYVPRRPRPISRIVHELSWIGTAGPVLWGHGWWADAWIVVSPPFSGAMLGAVVARAGRVPVHLHVQDVVPDIAVESGQLGSPFVRRLALGLARRTYSSYRSISVLSEGMRRRLGTYVDNRTRTNVRIIPNWVRAVVVTGAPRPKRIPFPLYAVFAGSLGEKQGLASLTEAADLLAARGGPGIVVLGDGPGRERLRRAGSILWLGLVETAEYAAVLSHAVAGIVTLQPGVGNSILPSKLLGYMGYGVPVIVSADSASEAAQLVQAVGCGVAVAPGRGDLLAQAVVDIARDPMMQRAMGARGAEYAGAAFSREGCIDLFERTVLGLVAERNRRHGDRAEDSK